jgi:hypothetical protein
MLFAERNLAEWELVFLKKLTPQESELMANPTFAKTMHL